MQGRDKTPDQPCTEARRYKQRKDLRQNKSERGPEAKGRFRLYQRNHDRHKQGCEKIYQNSVCGDSRHVTSQFAGHYRSSRRRRADKAEHSTLYQHHALLSSYRKQPHYADCNQSQHYKEPSLNKQQPPMPSMRLEVLRLNCTECQKEHQEYQQRLYHSHRIRQESPEEMQSWQRMIYQITGCPYRHSDR